MTISDEAVEAAARKMAQPPPYDFDKYPQYWTQRARIVLEAAAPLIMAEAWDSGWTHARGNYLALSQGREIPDWVTLRNPYRSVGAGDE